MIFNNSCTSQSPHQAPKPTDKPSDRRTAPSTTGSRWIALSLLLTYLVICPVLCEPQTDDYKHTAGRCITQGSCGSSIPCAHNDTDTLTPDADHTSLLHRTCPMYADYSKVCCTKSQLEDFDSQLAVVKSIVGNCEACMWDFKKIQCSWFCDPDQSQFIQILNTSNYTDPVTSETKLAVDKFRYYISTVAAKRMYTTCKDVRDSITGGIGLVYICGKPNCDESEFYNKLGDNSYTDLLTEYVITDTSPEGADYIAPLPNKDIYDCTDVVQGKTCNCLDCEAKPCEEVVVEKNTKWHYTVPVGIVLCLLLCLLITALTFMHKDKPVREDIDMKSPNIGVDNRAVDLNSPVPVHGGIDNRAMSTSPPVPNGDVPEANGDKDGPSPVPRDVVISPQLSTVSTVSPISPVHDEQRSLIRDKTPWYECWLSHGPRLGEKWSNLIYDFPLITLVAVIVIAGACSAGLYNFRITTDPVELWTSPASESRKNKIDYDNVFGTTYRTCQMVIKEKSPTTFGVEDKTANGVFNPIILKQVFDMMSAVQELKGGSRSYQELCYKPLGEFNTTHPTEDCATLSVFQWIDNNRTELDYPLKYLERFELCADATMLPECLSSFRGPSATNVVLGGYDADSPKYLDSTTLMVTFPLDGSPDKLADILKWETAMKDYLLEQKELKTDLFIAFSSDRALEDEIDRASHADIFTIVLGYILMFVYVAVSLGDIHMSFKGCLLNSKAMLGVGGVIIVLISVLSALGVTSYAGLPSTLIVIEVIPFLILAVGVDNVYIMVQGIQRIINEKIERQEALNTNQVKGILARTMSSVLPSMLMSSLCQMVAFALGSLSFMPSVQNFAYNATIALLMNFTLQTTLFFILLRFDLTRQLSKRLDVLYCVKAEKQEKTERGPTRWFIEEIWIKFLYCSKWVSAVILMVFGCFCIANVMLLPELRLGLDATMALPTDSYLRHYYQTAYNDFRVGPGVSFVFKPSDGSEYLNIYDDKIYDQLVGADNSLYKTIVKYGDSPKYPFIDGTGSSFMNVYNDSWLDSAACCWNNATGFCPSIEDRTGCSECNQTNMSTDTKYQYLHWFIGDIPRTDGSGCSDGGAVSYANAAIFQYDTGNNSTLGVKAGKFSSSHGALRTSNNFIDARHQAMDLVKEVNAANPDITVYAYGSFYHFYEQYDTIIQELCINIVLCVVATFLVALALLGFNLHAALCILLAVTMTTVDMIGAMVYLDIPLNAVSLVNLLMSVGISVEFSSHIVGSYTTSPEKTRLSKSRGAMRHVGPAIISGIAFTNFVGVLVLAAAKSQLFVVFYFKMFFTINCLCLFHTVIFLPAFLAFLG